MMGDVLSTRLVTSYSSGMVYNYEVGDAFGIFPESGSPIKFESTTTGSSVTIDAGFWKTKDGKTYATYYPYSYENQDYKAIPFNFEGQVQTGNDNANHISSSILKSTVPTEPVDGKFTAEMQMVCAVLRIGLVMPSTCNVTKVVIENSKNSFAVKGTINLFEDGFPMTASQNGTSDTMTLSFASPVEMTSGSRLIGFLNIAAPVTFVAGSLAFYIYDDQGNVYSATRNSSDTIEQNACHGMSVTGFELTDTGILGPLTGKVN